MVFQGGAETESLEDVFGGHAWVLQATSPLWLQVGLIKRAKGFRGDWFQDVEGFDSTRCQVPSRRTNTPKQVCTSTLVFPGSDFQTP